MTVSLEMRNLDLKVLSVADRLHRVKSCMRRAGKSVAETSLRRGANSNEEKLFWSLSCARSLFHGHCKHIVRATYAYPYLEHFVLVSIDSHVVCCLGLEGLNRHIADLMQSNLSNIRAQLVRDSDCSEQHFR